MTAFTGIDRGILTLYVCALTACTAEVGHDLADSDPVRSVEQRVTGANPLVDVEYWGAMTPAAGASYANSDLGISNTYIFLRRSSGTVEVRSRSSGAPLVTTLTGSYGRIKYDDSVTPSWGLVGTRDSERKIYRNIDTTPTVLGNYPAGVNSIFAIASHWNDIFIMYVPGPGPTRLIRKGTYQPSTTSINWQSTTADYGMYTGGFCFSQYSGFSHILYRHFNYTLDIPSYFQRATGYGSGASWTGENIAPYTEHAWHHPSGFDQRYVATMFDYLESDDRFYSIGGYTSGGTFNYVVLRIPRANLKF